MQLFGSTVCWKEDRERAKAVGLLVPCHWTETITASFRSGRKIELFVLASATELILIKSGVIATHLHETELYVN